MQTLEMGKTAQVFSDAIEATCRRRQEQGITGPSGTDRSSICQAALGRYGKCREELLLWALKLEGSQLRALSPYLLNISAAHGPPCLISNRLYLLKYAQLTYFSDYNPYW